MIIIYIDLISKRIFAARLHRRIVVWSGRHAAKETVIQSLRMIAGGAVVKHIPRYKQHINLFILNKSGKPVQEGLKLFISLAAIKSAADVPVRCVENFHGVSLLYGYGSPVIFYNLSCLWLYKELFAILPIVLGIIGTLSRGYRKLA